MEAFNLPTLLFDSSKDWETWLAERYHQPTGIWLQFAKKSAKTPSVTYGEALDVALCYGWIDGQLKSYNQDYYLQKFTPRRPKSIWSKRNIARADALIAANRMQSPGLKEIEAAKRDGRWQRAYDSPRNMTVPTDFQMALDQNPKAKAIFATLNRANVYAFLWRIQTAKKPETRKVRITRFIEMLEQSKTIHPSLPLKRPTPPVDGQARTHGH